MIRKAENVYLYQRDYTSPDFDVALVELNNEVDFARYQHIRPICLQDIGDKNTFDGSKVTVAGWGLTSLTGTTSNVLKKLDQKVISNEDCK